MNLFSVLIALFFNLSAPDQSVKAAPPSQATSANIQITQTVRQSPTVTLTSSPHITITLSPSLSPTITLKPTETPKPTLQPTAKPLPKPTSLPTARPTAKPITRPTTPPTLRPISTVAPPTVSTGYSCNCSKTCPNMGCAEAQFQLKSCGCSQRDADHDGIACDAQCQ